MALIKCPECGRDVSSEAVSCPNCGHPIKKTDVAQINAPQTCYTGSSTPKTPNKKNGCLTAFLIVLGVLFLIYVVGSIGSSSVSSSKKSIGSTQKTYPSATSKLSSYWSKQYYVDDFKQKTSKWYLHGEFQGDFSNTATTSSKLDVVLIVDHDYSKADSGDRFRIRMYEYGNYVVNYKYNECKNITIKVRINGRDYSANPDALQEEYLVIKRKSKIFGPALKALEAGDDVQFVIEDKQYSTSTYRFTVKGYGLKDLPHDWKF